MQFKNSLFQFKNSLLFAALGLSLAACVCGHSQQLPAYNVQKNHVFVAGVSSGAFMAVQMQVAYSRTFKGAAIYAGGPDGCAQDSLEIALVTCQSALTPIDPSALVATTQTWAQQDLIDPLRHLQNQPVYLWSGVLDATVRQPVMDALLQYYRALGVDVFRYDNSFPAAHGWESPYGPNLCPQAGSPYVLTCNTGADSVAASLGGAPYDSEQVWLTRFLGPLNAKNDGSLQGQLLPFNQDQFAVGGVAAALSLDGTGYLYAPKDCTAGAACGLLLALHGCNMSFSAIGSTFIDDAGLNQWADTNHLLVLYPQTIASAATGSNPQGCWDWWGYQNDPDYAQKSGPQMQTLFAMVAAVSAGRP